MTKYPQKSAQKNHLWQWPWYPQKVPEVPAKKCPKQSPVAITQSKASWASSSQPQFSSSVTYLEQIGWQPLVVPSSQMNPDLFTLVKEEITWATHLIGWVQTVGVEVTTLSFNKAAFTVGTRLFVTLKEVFYLREEVFSMEYCQEVKYPHHHTQVVQGQVLRLQAQWGTGK